jgi:predicted secreted protein
MLIAAAALGIAATALVAAAPAHAMVPASSDVTLTITELPGQVRLVTGEAVAVRLSTNLTTGYTWSTKVTGNASAVKVSKGRYTAPADTGTAGAPGTTTWTITATGPGRATVVFLATPPGGGTPERDGALRVIVGR